MSFTKSPMQSDLAIPALLAANMYEVSDISELIQCMMANSTKHDELRKIASEWLSAIHSCQINTDLHTGITILLYQRLIQTADFLNITIADKVKLQIKEMSESRERELIELKPIEGAQNPTVKPQKPEAKEAKIAAEHKTPASLSVTDSLPILDKDSLSNLQYHFFKHLSDDGQVKLSDVRRYILKQNAKGMLVIERKSFLTIEDMAVTMLTESLNKLDFLNSFANCFTSEKNTKGHVDHTLTITFSEEATKAIINPYKSAKKPLDIDAIIKQLRR